MQAKLFCKFGQLAGKEFDISDEATIGTNDSNGIVLNAATISENHARISLDMEGNIISWKTLVVSMAPGWTVSR